MSEETPDNKDDRHQHRSGDLPWDVVSPTDLVEYWTADGGHHLQIAVKAPWSRALTHSPIEFFRPWRPERVNHIMRMSGPHKTDEFFSMTRSWDAFDRMMEQVTSGELHGLRFLHPEIGDLILTKDGVAAYEEPKVDNPMLNGVTTIKGLRSEAVPLNAALLNRILSATPHATNEMMDAGVAAARGEPPAQDGQIGHAQVRAIWDTMAALMPGLSIVGTEALKQAFNKRNDDLLDANIRYEEAARQARAERDEARQDAGNTERENAELRSIIFSLYVAAGGPKIDIPDHAPLATLQTLVQHIPSQPVRIGLKWIRRDDLTTEDAVRLAGQQVYIRTDNGIWRSRNPKSGGGNGYTSNPAEADTWTFIEAYDQTAGCGPEKEAAFGYRAEL